MKQTIKMLAMGLESSTQTTAEFRNFARVFRKELKAELKKEYTLRKIKFFEGYFYVSGFFELHDGKLYYFALPDVRAAGTPDLLIRTAEDWYDFTGGRNNYITLGIGMFKNLVLPKV